ncbi:MAG TPA: hypothetical protein VD948_07015 [Rhodothermales bacterium]|nr:hypothetical protein [Rhodothermales bacterium]
MTTGAFTSDARRYARKINATSAVTIFLLDAHDVRTVREAPGAFGRVLRAQAERILAEKMRHVVWSGLEKQAPAATAPDFTAGDEDEPAANQEDGDQEDNGTAGA